MPDEGESEKLGAPTVTVVWYVPSEMVSVPVPDPVVTTTVADVPEDTFCDIFVTPVTPESVNVGLDQVVPRPVKCRVM